MATTTIRTLPFPLLAFLLLLAGLAGCAGDRAAWHGPTTAVPDKWSLSLPTEGETPPRWWTGFQDPRLDALMDRALQGNNDLAAAAVRVRRAELAAGLVDTNRTPAVAVAANSTLARSFDPAATTRSSGVSGALFYEPDAWGRLAGQRQVAAWEAAASEADCQGFAAALTVATARLYWQVTFLNQLVALGETDIASAEKTLGLVRAKYGAGAVSGLEPTQAELVVSNLQAVQTQLLQQRTQTRHALAVLLSLPPGSAIDERARLPEQPLPAIAPGVPAAMLTNRADLRAAELRLRETFANIEVTRASFYPTFSLTGTLSTASRALTDFLQNPVATLGVGLALPFVQWNTRKLSIKVSEAQHEEAVINFRQTLLGALREVEDGLAARAQLLVQGEALARALEQARRGEAIAKARYLAGATEFRQWLDAQASLRAAERAVTGNRLNQLVTQAELYRALGLGMQGLACRR